MYRRDLLVFWSILAQIQRESVHTCTALTRGRALQICFETSVLRLLVREPSGSRPVAKSDDDLVLKSDADLSSSLRGSNAKRPLPWPCRVDRLDWETSQVFPVKTARPAKTTPSRTVRAMGTPERGQKTLW